MGCFSFLDCVNPEYNFKMTNDDGYLLIPKEIVPVIKEFLPLSYEYFDGDRKLWGEYDGYGRFGSIDVYEFLAFINLYGASDAEKEKIIRSIYKNDTVSPKEEFVGLWSFEREELLQKGVSEEEVERIHKKKQEEQYNAAVLRRKRKEDMILSYSPDMEDAREVGIDLFFFVKNENLKYPLKITHCDDVEYEDCSGYSEDDPDQGY